MRYRICRIMIHYYIVYSLVFNALQAALPAMSTLQVPGTPSHEAASYARAQGLFSFLFFDVFRSDLVVKAKKKSDGTWDCQPMAWVSSTFRSEARSELWPDSHGSRRFHTRNELRKSFERAFHRFKTFPFAIFFFSFEKLFT